MFLLFLLLAVAADPNQSTDLLKQGLISLQKNRLTEARQQLESAAKLSPNNPYIWTSLADAYWRLNERPKASASAETAAKFRSGNPQVTHALAIFYTRALEFKQAAPLEEEYALSPQADPDALGRAADLYLNAGDAAKAVELATQAHKKNPSAANLNRFGRALIASGDLSGGVKALSDACAAEPSNEGFAFDYAQTLLRKADFSGAAAALEPAFAAHPSSAQLNLGMGVVRYGQRRFPEAIDSFLKTISIDPLIPQPYEFLGRMLDQAGPRLPEITSAYQTWARKEPGQFQPPLLLAKAQFTASGDPAVIERNLRKSITLNSQNWESHFLLGQLLETRRDFRGAQQELEKSIQLNAEEPMPHYHLARVLDRLGEPEKAAAERAIHARLQSQRPNQP